MAGRKHCNNKRDDPDDNLGNRDDPDVMETSLTIDYDKQWLNCVSAISPLWLCCVTMFVVGGNTCNNTFQLASQQCCVASCSNLLLVLLHL